MDDILVGIAKLTFLIFKPLFKGIAWIFVSIFKAIGKAIGGFFVKKAKEVAPDVATAVGVGAVAAGATVIAEEVKNAKYHRKISKIKKNAISYEEIKIVNGVVTTNEPINNEEVRTYKKVPHKKMNCKNMKSLLGTNDDIFVEDALKYWKALENADLEEFTSIRTSLWS